MSGFGSSNIYGVIGLGLFGTSLAETLAENGQEVIVLDNNESKINQIQDKVMQAFVVPNLDKTSLREGGHTSLRHRDRVHR